MIRVLIADDHNLVRKGIRSLLEADGAIEVVYEASDGYEAVEKVQELQPDVAILDLSMPRLDGVQASEKILGLGLTLRLSSYPCTRIPDSVSFLQEKRLARRAVTACNPVVEWNKTALRYRWRNSRNMRSKGLVVRSI